MVQIYITWMCKFFTKSTKIDTHEYRWNHSTLTCVVARNQTRYIDYTSTPEVAAKRWFPRAYILAYKIENNGSYNPRKYYHPYYDSSPGTAASTSEKSNYCWVMDNNFFFLLLGLGGQKLPIRSIFKILQLIF